MLILPRNRLAFPAGMRPGFSPTHPAANGLGGDKKQFSAIASFGATFGGTLLNLLTGAQADTIAGIPTFNILGAIGPSLAFAAPSTAQFTGGLGNTTTADSSVTFGAILQRNSTTAGSGIIISDDTNGTNGRAAQGINVSGALILVFWGGSLVTSSLVMAVGVPYFYGVSADATSTRFVLVNLLTGRIQTDVQAAPTPAVISGANGSIIIGTTGSRFINSSIAAVMYAPKSTNMAQLTQWANDPWAFWYPQSLRGFDFAVGTSVILPPPTVLPFSGLPMMGVG